MQIIENIPAWLSAKWKLEQMEITFDRVIAHDFNDDLSPFIYYFMEGDCDVAYFTVDLNTLAIHDKPRQWGKCFLDKAKVIY